jgi:hypothetical protein
VKSSLFVLETKFMTWLKTPMPSELGNIAAEDSLVTIFGDQVNVPSPLAPNNHKYHPSKSKFHICYSKYKYSGWACTKSMHRCLHLQW